MRIRWWRSIRLRLALGSMLVALFATTLLALSAILAIIYYYDIDQVNRLDFLAADNALRISDSYGLNKPLAKAVRIVFPLTSQQSSQYVLVVLDSHNQVIYPAKLSQQSAFVKTVGRLARRFSPPSAQNKDSFKIYEALKKGQVGISTDDDIGHTTFLGMLSRPFAVRPIFVGGQDNAPVAGVLLMLPRAAAENTIPRFITAVGEAVLIASVVVAVLAALAAILFSRTITRPLARLTRTARVLASGDYSAQVTTNAQGELGELAHTFNEMAAQLNRDVEELRRQEQWRRELIMNITHDLATPLTAIAGLGESLLDGVNQSREDYEVTGRIIVRETLRLRRLVRDLHMMAKVEAGALHPQRKAVRLAALVDEVLAVLSPEFERANVEPNNVVPHTLPVVQADPDMLTRVFSNLCDNALRHTPSGGVVTVEAIQQGNMLAVAVTDTGEGIPTEALPRIFERFFRADSARQLTKGGSGLGLAIVYAIIEAHGGMVWAENVPGAGARIAFTLPLQATDTTTK